MWLRKIAQSFFDTQYWSNQFREENPGYQPQFNVFQSPDFPHVFLGGEDDLQEAEQMAGQPMCKVVDCRDLPEIDQAAWDYPEFLTVQREFDAKVKDLIQKITTTDCPIFVHCALGANRSVAVLAAALTQLTGKSVNQVLSEMKQVRAFVGPQDPYYLMALQQSPSETPEFKQQRFDELDQDFPLIQPELPTNTAQYKECNLSWLQKLSQQKLLIIARGPSGSGKSRMTEKISEQYNAPVFSSDDFFMVNGKYQFDRDYVGDAHFWNQGRVEEAMQGDVPVVIVDNTNTKFHEMKPYVLMAQKYGYTTNFQEPDWDPRLKTPDGRWNVDFLEEMQNQPDRDKVVPRDILESMVGGYAYDPTVEAVLGSERPKL